MSFSVLPLRDLVQTFRPYTAGRSIDEIREEYGLDRVIKLASNENPLGASPQVRDVLCRRADYVFRYPQAGNPRLVQALAAYHQLLPSRIVVGNGSDEIIDLLFRICAEPRRNNAVAFKPCFGIYTTQAALCGIELRQAPLNPDFSFPWADLQALIDENTALVFVTTPDNPSGYTPPVEELMELARNIPKTCLLVVDEAYMDFTGNEAAYSILPHLDAFPNVAVVRTFSKCFGMAGLRLGYGILPEIIADYMWRVRLPFSVNLLAEEAALAALGDTLFRARTIQIVAEGREFLMRELTALGCRVFPSQANFLMFEVPSTASDAAALNEALLRRGVIVRPLGSYGLARHLRVSVGTEEENVFFLQALREILVSN